MKKTGLNLILAITVICCVASCRDEKDKHEERWMFANIEALNTIMGNPEYKEIQSPGNEGSIYYKALQSGEGTDTIRYTSIVSCYYKGWFIADYTQYNIKSGDKFDQQLFDDGPPSFFTINSTGLIKGWKTALQHMVKGDKWEIWIPYQLAYGRSGQTDSKGKVIIPAYSTLVFELEVTSVIKIDD